MVAVTLFWASQWNAIFYLRFVLGSDIHPGTFWDENGYGKYECWWRDNFVASITSGSTHSPISGCKWGRDTPSSFMESKRQILLYSFITEQLKSTLQRLVIQCCLVHLSVRFLSFIDWLYLISGADKPPPTIYITGINNGYGKWLINCSYLDAPVVIEHFGTSWQFEGSRINFYVADEMCLKSDYGIEWVEVLILMVDSKGYLYCLVCKAHFLWFRIFVKGL